MKFSKADGVSSIRSNRISKILLYGVSKIRLWLIYKFLGLGSYEFPGLRRFSWFFRVKNTILGGQNVARSWQT